jgi:Serine dehydrogenase proteinase
LGVYTEYLDKQLAFPDLTAERKLQLQRISSLRKGRDILVYAADLNKGNTGAPISIDYSDILPISDQLANLSGSALDVIIETPGGDGTVAEDIVRLLRGKYKELAFIVPGYAKSAGTIITMAGDEILMGPTSALGPIDAQLFWQGKVFSAEALLDGMERIKDEVQKTNALNRAYIPILQGISPGELQGAQNALDFAVRLVTDWLANYKFKDWKTHASSGQPVTDAERIQRATEIADQLRSHKKWLTHGRSIKMDDLRKMKLQITDYAADPQLHDAIHRYYTLLQMTFQTNAYKVIETPTSQIYRFAAPAVQPAQMPGGGPPAVADIAVKCLNCGQESQVQANIGVAQPLQSGKFAFPPNDRFKCPNCAAETDLGDTRRQLEAQTKQRVVT